MFGVLNYVGYFFIYSFAGFILETLFAMTVQGELAMRKCFLVFPMCPVYGFGALAIILLTKPFRDNLFAVFGIGMLAASAVEYFTDFIYREVIGVAFWDYNDMPLNINGRVCLLVSFIWGILSVALVKWLHPGVESLIKATPRWMILTVLILFLIDAVASTTVLMKFKSKDALNVFSHMK